MDLDLILFDLEAKARFAALDWIKARRVELIQLRQDIERLKVWRAQNPIMFDQITVIAIAAVLEVVVSYLKRR